MQDFYDFLYRMQSISGIGFIILIIVFITTLCYAIYNTVTFLINVCFFAYKYMLAFYMDLYWDYKYKCGIFTKRKAK